MKHRVSCEGNMNRGSRKLYNTNLRGSDLNTRIHYLRMNSEHPVLENMHSRNLKLWSNPKGRPATLSNCNTRHDPFVVSLGTFQVDGIGAMFKRVYLEIECPLIERAWRISECLLTQSVRYLPAVERESRYVEEDKENKSHVAKVMR
jgi:hypothetical protein